MYTPLKMLCYLGPLEKLVLACSLILVLALPSLEYTSLKGTAVGEGQGPWLLALEFVDGIQVDGSILF